MLFRAGVGIELFTLEWSANLTAKKTAIVFRTANWPHSGGGGRGVLYRLLRHYSVDFPEIDGCDIFGLFSDQLISIRGPNDITNRIIAEVPTTSSGPKKWLVKAKNKIALLFAYDKIVCIAFEGFNLEPLLWPKARRLIILGEHSKGGIHQEFRALNQKAKWSYFLRRCLVHREIKRADIVIFPSAGAKKLFFDANPTLGLLLDKKAIVIFNGIDDPFAKDWGSALENMKGGKRNGISLVSIADNVPEKGVDLLLSGLAEFINASGHDSERVHLKIIGRRTDYTPALEKMAVDLGIQKQVEFLGSATHEVVLGEILSSDAFVLTPRVAVFDLALLEAMAAGKPIISTPVGGNVEALGSDYRLYALNKIDVAKHLRLIQMNPTAAAEIGQENRRRFEKYFTSATMGREYWNLIQKKVS